MSEKSAFRQLPGLGARISVGRFGQLDLYPPSEWRVLQDIVASASSIPSQRTELRRLFRETIPDCTLQCGPTKRNLSTRLAKATIVVRQQHPAIFARCQYAPE
jgi:hypothetical protein